ncbi:MAG: response regulator [Acidobacteriota bacterium]
MTASRILIVDDNAMNLEMASFLLTQDGWEVAEAKDAAQAMACLQTFCPDVVLMDIQLPDVDGLTAARQIKEQVKDRDVPVIAFTAYAMRGDKARLLAAGCDGYIAKPIDVSTFSSEIRAVADQA